MTTLDLAPVNKPHSASLVSKVLAQGRYETRVTVTNGEQLLVSIILPLLALAGLYFTDLFDSPGGPSTIDIATPGILALSVLSSGLTGQGIATGFDRRYGVLQYLATTPLGPVGLLLGKAVAVLMVQVTQLVVIGGVALLLGWSPAVSGLGFALLFVALGALAFTALGLLIAGTVRAEATLAITNISWVILGALGGVVFPIAEFAGSVFINYLPSAALGNGLRAALVEGNFDAVSCVILAVWTVVLSLGTIRWFKWR
ncbi:ABC transporter permease [Enteractinococcus coprophilus]|uniref:ABC-2 type transport system permease protein n=1 Tax=Enteractinococcus coprophilus TaxID=1027633 RepID=A0A543AJ91_9MICC|nr:ABC transporter permease [Enteractinococcus coprophilus]TQL72639.1 ABC-2 type transport system permease protein [Enteractinococcus coprophilus]